MESASAGLARILRDLLTRAPEEERPVLAWPFICGPGVSNTTRATGFADGVLRVEVADNTWRTQLMDLAPQYVAAFANLLGGVVKRIEFTVDAKAKEERKGRAEERKGRGERRERS